MSVVIESGSKQYLIQSGQKFVVDRLKEIKEGDSVDLPVLLGLGVDKDKKSIKVKVIGHVRGQKMRVVKYKSKSNYHRQYGFRAEQTVLLWGEDLTKKAASKPKIEKVDKPTKLTKKTEAKSKVEKVTKEKKATSSTAKKTVINKAKKTKKATK